MLVRGLPAGRRRTFLRDAIAARDFRRAAAVAGTSDPFPAGALFAAVDILLTQGDDAAIPEVTSLARNLDPFAQAIWQALSAHGAGDRARALRLLSTAGRDDPYLDMCARAWALFLRLPRLEGGGTGPGPTILQYWDTPNVPADVLKVMDGWRALAGERHARLDVDTARAFLRAEYGTLELRVFDACLHPAIQSDYVRLAWLARHGGLYVDADARMRPAFPALWPAMAGRTVVWFYSDTVKGHFTNGLMAAPPESPLVLACLNEAGRRILDDPQGHVYALGGPGMLTETMLDLARRGELGDVAAMTSTTVRTRVMTQIDAAYKKDRRSWHRWQGAKPWERGEAE